MQILRRKKVFTIVETGAMEDNQRDSAVGVVVVVPDGGGVAPTPLTNATAVSTTTPLSVEETHAVDAEDETAAGVVGKKKLISWFETSSQRMT